jgi:hypothetical protein
VGRALALVLLCALPALAQTPPQRIDVDFEEEELAAALGAVANFAATTVVVDPEVQAPITVSLRDIPWREAVDVMARMCRCDVEELAPGVLWVSRPARVTVEFQDTDVTTVLRLIASYAGVELVVTPGVVGRVSLDLTEEPWLRAMQTVAAAAGLWLEERSGLVVVRPGPAPARPAPAVGADDARELLRPPLVSLELDGPIADALERVGKAADRNVLVDPNVTETLRLSLRRVPWRVAVDLVARLTRCQVEARAGGILVLTRAPRTRYNAVGAPAAAWFQLLGREAGLNVVSAGAQGTIDCDLTGLRPDEVLEATARAAGLELAWSDGGGGARGDTVTLRPRPVVEDLQAPAHELDPLLDDIARLAKDGQAERLAPRLQELLARTRARGGRAAPPRAGRPPAPSPPPAEVLARFDGLLDHMDLLAAERRVEDLVETMAELKALLREQGPGLVRAAPARLAKRPPTDAREVELSILLAVFVEHGNLLLRAMDEAVGREEPSAVRGLFLEVEELAESMRAEEREVFHRNAEALYLRARSRRDHAKRLEEMLAFPLALSATVVAPASEGSEPRAILNGWLVAAGDDVKDADGGPLPVKVVEVVPGAVRVRWEDLEFVRALQGR